MDLALLASEIKKDPDLNKLVSIPRGRISRFEIKVALLKTAGKAKYKQIVAAIPEFATDPDFAEIDVLHQFSVEVFDDLRTNGLLTQAEREMITQMGYEQVPRWKALGFPERPHGGDIEEALKQNP